MFDEYLICFEDDRDELLSKAPSNHVIFKRK